MRTWVHETCLGSTLKVGGEMGKWKTGKKERPVFLVGKCNNFAEEDGGSKKDISYVSREMKLTNV